MSKTFTFAGVSRKNGGEFRVRCANSETYVKVLMADGHTDIDLIGLKEPMLKEDVIAYLISIDFDNGRDDVRQALEAAVEKYSVPAEKAPRVKVERPAKVKPSLEAIAAKGAAKKAAAVKQPVDAALEEAPF
jgi:hypothetical protein